MKILISLVMTMSFSTNAFDVFILSEQSLSSLAEEVPRIKQIEAVSNTAKLTHYSFKDQFSPNLKAGAFYSENKEKQLSNFVPVTSPIKNFTLGVEQRTPYGFKVEGQAFASQSSNNFIHSSTTTGFLVSLTMDLHKDFLGKTTKTELGNRELQSKKAKLEETIAKKAFTQNIRKLYWALVANNEAKLLTQKLLATATTQVREAEARFRNKVADSGEVARYRSQVAARRAGLISLQYQESGLIQNLKEALPSLGNKSIKLASYNLDDTVQDVLACSTMLESKTGSPFEFTLYDEVVENLRNQDRHRDKIDNLYDTWDLSLQSDFKVTGKEFTYSDSFDDLKSDSRDAYQVGVQLTIPLGSRKKETKEVLKIVQNKRNESEREANLARLDAYHTQIVQSVTLLKEVVKNQKINSFNLAESLKVTRKKFDQARISVEQLVQEQDVFLNSNLSEIETKLNIVNTLLDYFSVYTETPCELNRI